jgi:hypothetical protein
MTARERRGKWICLTIAVLITLDKLGGIGLALSGGLDQVKWWQSVVLPLCMVSGILFLVRDGDNWLRWLIGLVLIANCALRLFVFGRIAYMMAEHGSPEGNDFLIRAFGVPVGLLVAREVLYGLFGLALLTLPSLRAYFEHRRFLARLKAFRLRLHVYAVAMDEAERDGRDEPPAEKPE